MPQKKKAKKATTRKPTGPRHVGGERTGTTTFSCGCVHGPKGTIKACKRHAPSGNVRK